MSRPLRLLLIFLLLLTLLAVEAAWLFSMREAELVAGGLVSALVVVLGLVFRGRRPGFTRTERQRVFGHLVD